MLLSYLSESPVAPLQSRLVEVPDPFCSEISDSVYENSESCVGFTFSGVPTEQLGLLEDKCVHTHCSLPLLGGEGINFLGYFILPPKYRLMWFPFSTSP